MISSITFFGKGTNRYLYCKSLLLDFLSTFSFDVKIQEVTSLNEMMERDIASIPSVCINGEYLSISKTELVEDFVLRCISLIICRVPNPRLKIIRLTGQNTISDIHIFDQLKRTLSDRVVAIQLDALEETVFDEKQCFKHIGRTSPSFIGFLTHMLSYVPIIEVKKDASCVTNLPTTIINLSQKDWKKHLVAMELSSKKH